MARHSPAAFLAAGLVLLPAPARPEGAAGPVVVSAAASLRGAFLEIAALPARSPGTRAALNFGASGDLLAQIRGGAPVDVFASASREEMDELERAGLLARNTRADFAANEIVLIVPTRPSATASSFAELASHAVARIGVGNPATVPAGRYAAEVFASAGLAAGLQTKLVPAENVRQVLDWVARGEADAGVVYATDALTKAREVRVVAAAPAGSHRRILYPIAVLRDAPHPEAARAFVDAVHSGAGQAILARHGFLPVGKADPRD